MIEDAASEAAPKPQKIAIWDLPTRLFHWTLAALIAFSWWTAEEHHDDLHLYSGFAILSLLLFRILWGLVGSSTARFVNFVRGPRAVSGYLRGSWAGIGHNPLGALSVIAPTYRTSDVDIREFGRALRLHAEALSLSLGAPVDLVQALEPEDALA